MRGRGEARPILLHDLCTGQRVLGFESVAAIAASSAEATVAERRLQELGNSSIAA
jgi:hypothetical protein